MPDEKIHILDHGSAELVEFWGSDERIVEAARMSTNKGFKGWGPFPSEEPCDTATCVGGTLPPNEPNSRSHNMPCFSCNATGRKLVAGDEKLLRYLWENKHATPFEMAGLTVEIQAPIFVFRQWHRHRTQAYNEMSARYTPLPALDYVPTVDRLMVASVKNRQAGKVLGADEMTAAKAEAHQANLRSLYKTAQQIYEVALSQGVPKELARLHLPVARYSRMRASANLRNWLGFLTLRLDPHAQYESRVYAEAVGSFIETAFPRTWALFAEGLRA